MMSQTPQSRKQNVLTVVLEDYFHVGALSSVISPSQWDRFENRFEINTLKTLELLKEFDLKATFFVLGWIAKRRPELIAEVASQGHEIANYGFYHRDVRQMTREEFREDSRRSRDALEEATGRCVIGYRIPQGLNAHSDPWMLDVLAEEGYVYDSSVVPRGRAEKWERQRFVHRYGDREIWEFPHATVNCLGYLLPISGGNYFRQIPHTLVKRAVRQWKKSFDDPFMMYFHIWELDPDQPRIRAVSLLARTRQYRKLNKMSWVLRDYFHRYKFTSIADYLGHDTLASTLPVAEEQPPLAIETTETASRAATPLLPRTPLTIVVPCYNERPALPYLANTLASVSKLLQHDYKLSFVFVDDGSNDGTWEILNRLFGDRKDCRRVQHPQNRGVAAAILTGIRHAESEIVCSIDCDCSYDPHDLMQMVPMLTEDVDLVTASPYHAQGNVMNVPQWRLGLSKAASLLYRRVLRNKLATYTSCFRVYRRSMVVNLQLQEFGYLGVVEILGLLDLQGARIAEFPATLHVRILGQSKMKIARTVIGHLKNLWRMRHIRRLMDKNPRTLSASQSHSIAGKSETRLNTETFHD